jgi:alpha-1,2-mannosyltransferase
MSVVERIAERFGDRLRGVARPWEVVCFAWVPAVVLGFGLWYALRARGTLGDFPIFRAASKAVLHGHSPYVAADPGALANFDKFVYPPAAAFLLSPLAVTPFGFAKVLVFVLGVVTALLAFRLLGVRDWRCYGVAAVSAPVMNSLAIGALTSFLLLGAALTWRCRDRPSLAGSAASVTAVVKLFLWPLGLWLVVTRRLRAAAAFFVVGVVGVVAGWAAIGFAGFRAYPHLLRVLADLEAGVSYSPVALLRLSGSGATALSVVLVITVVVAVALAARGTDGDRRSFTIAVIGSLVATPVLWLNYFALLLIPIALYRPRLSGLWFAPLVLWATPETHSGGSLWRIGLALAIVVFVAGRVLSGSGRVKVADQPQRLGPAVACNQR